MLVITYKEALKKTNKKIFWNITDNWFPSHIKKEYIVNIVATSFEAKYILENITNENLEFKYRFKRYEFFEWADKLAQNIFLKLKEKFNKQNY